MSTTAWIDGLLTSALAAARSVRLDVAPLAVFAGAVSSGIAGDIEVRVHQAGSPGRHSACLDRASERPDPD